MSRLFEWTRELRFWTTVYCNKPVYWYGTDIQEIPCRYWYASRSLGRVGIGQARIPIF